MANISDKWLNLSRLELSVYADNEPVVTLYKKFRDHYCEKLKK